MLPQSVLLTGTGILEQVSCFCTCLHLKLLASVWRDWHDDGWYTQVRLGLCAGAESQAALTWPASLASTVLFRALHEPQEKIPANGWTIGRYRFFLYTTAFAFVLFWFPDYIWTSTSTFAFITWIVPNNQKVNTIFGMSSGLGLLPLSIDWTQITYAGAPLTSELILLTRLTESPFLYQLQCVRCCGSFLPLPISHLILRQCLEFGIVSATFQQD